VGWTAKASTGSPSTGPPSTEGGEVVGGEVVGGAMSHIFEIIRIASPSTFGGRLPPKVIAFAIGDHLWWTATRRLRLLKSDFSNRVEKTNSKNT